MRLASFGDPLWRGVVVLVVYGYQGLVAGFGLTALPNHLAETGITAEAIGGFIAVVGLPWAVQPLWGPVVDRFRARGRRAWLLAGFAGALGALVLLVGMGEGLAGLTLALALHSACAALIDTALDAMIIDQVPAARLGHATALTRVGFVTGTAVGAALFAWVIPAHGITAAATLLLGLGLGAALAPVLVREAHVATASQGGGARMLWAILRRRRTLVLLAVCLAIEFATACFGVRLAVAMIQTGGWDAAALSRLQAGVILFGGTVGALAIGAWSDRAGPYRALVILFVLTTAAFLASGLGLLLRPASALVAAAALALTTVLSALVFVACAPAIMRDSRGDAAASHFALFMAALNLGGIAGAAASGPVGAVLTAGQTAVGAAIVFALAAVIASRPERLFEDAARELEQSIPGRRPIANGDRDTKPPQA